MKKQLAIYLMTIGSSLAVLTACDNAVGKKEDAIAKQMEIKRINDSLKLDSFKRAESARIALKEQEEARRAETKSFRASESSIIPTNNTQNVIHPVASSPQNQKKGWSDAAKGTAIGAGVGAGVGALIDKDKRGRGAIIGGVIGAGGGYAIGRKSDRESGRVQKK